MTDQDDFPDPEELRPRDIVKVPWLDGDCSMVSPRLDGDPDTPGWEFCGQDAVYLVVADAPGYDAGPWTWRCCPGDMRKWRDMDESLDVRLPTSEPRQDQQVVTDGGHDQAFLRAAHMAATADPDPRQGLFDPDDVFQADDWVVTRRAGRVLGVRDDGQTASIPVDDARQADPGEGVKVAGTAGVGPFDIPAWRVCQVQAAMRPVGGDD